MGNERFILVDAAFEEKMLKEFQSLKELFAGAKAGTVNDGIRWMDNADIMEYLHISRRTTLTLRQKGLPFSQIDGKIFYRKDLVDAFLTNHQIQLKTRRNGS